LACFASSFVLNQFNVKKTEDIMGFATFLTETFVNNGYLLSLITLKDIPLFFAKVTKGSDIRYFRYYYDDKEQVSKTFSIPITEIVLSKNTNDSRLIEATRQPIPIYNKNLTV
jgi:hypothetical protein